MFDEITAMSSFIELGVDALSRITYFTQAYCLFVGLSHLCTAFKTPTFFSNS